jgi:hypothetical protein
MAPPNAVKERKRYFSVDEANKMLPLVQRIVADIVRQWETVHALEQRLAVVNRRSRKRGAQEGDVYEEEVAQSQSEMEAERSRLCGYIEELKGLGVELKGPDGLCDFPSLRDGREVYLCWRLGEPKVAHWHELQVGYAGRQPLDTTPAGAGRGGNSAR